MKLNIHKRQRQLTLRCLNVCLMLLCILCSCSRRFWLDFIQLPTEHRCYKHQGHGSQFSQPSVQIKPHKKISSWYYFVVQFPTENALRATVAIGFCNRARVSDKKAFFPVTSAMVFRNSCMYVLKNRILQSRAIQITISYPLSRVAIFNQVSQRRAINVMSLQ